MMWLTSCTMAWSEIQLAIMYVLVYLVVYC